MELLKTFEGEGNKKKAEVYEGQTKEGKSYFSTIGINQDGVYTRRLYQGWLLAEAERVARKYIS